MQLETLSYHLPTRAWSRALPELDSERTLVLAFGAPSAADQPEVFDQLRAAFPSAVVLGCSGSGEIHGAEIRDQSVSVAVARFEHSRLQAASVRVEDPADSRAAGVALARKLADPQLRAVFVLSEGLKVNGSELVRGFNEALPADVVVTGGLAGDGTRFERTWVVHGRHLESGLVAAVGLYGPHVVVGHGSKGGWDRFGPERTVTRSEGNVLYELDGRPALALYKEYLGAKAAELPASGLLFPLAMRSSASDDKVLVRTLLAVDEAAQSMTFAGDLPRGALVQLMKADFERLINGAEGAAGLARPTDVSGPVLAVAVSCVGRRLVLGDRTEEEVEAVRDVLPPDSGVVGFYSYGELSPFATGRCDLHNQTMTLTTFAEADVDVTESVEHTDVSPRADETAPFQRGQGGMVVASAIWRDGAFAPALPALDSDRTLVLAFGSPDLLDDPRPLRALAEAFPRSAVLGCSGAGEIAGTEILDRGLSVAVARFARTTLRTATVRCSEASGSRAAGRELGRALAAPDLHAVFVLSEGLSVNGSELVRGIDEVLGAGVVVTGGLAGDDTRFQRTWVSHGAEVRSGWVVAVGLYGEHVVVGHGSKGGWDAFGPLRTVTRSAGNVLYELDGRPALGLYKEYLGAKAAELPASGLLFPLALTMPGDDKVLVRTLLSVDEAAQTMTFAGDLPVGARAQLMKADFERLVGGARGAAGNARSIAPPVEGSDTLAVAVSCVGRRLVLGDRTEEEIEAVEEALPERSVITGFYSYGELSPYTTGSCDLHNQTMTLTTFAESAQPRRRTGRMEAGGVHWSAGRGWSAPLPSLDSPRTLVVVFGDAEIPADHPALREVIDTYPRSVVVGCSGSGEIVGGEVRDGVLTVAIARFAHTDLRSSSCEIADASGSYEGGRKLGMVLAQPDLRAVFVLSEGLGVNGSELVRGLNDVLDPSVVVTGGLAGDGTRFQRTWVLHGGKARSGVVAAVGFYGDHVVIGHGSKGGWDRFGPERTITRSTGNVLYELDGQPALALYKQYLGAKATELPASGLLFPLAMRSGTSDDKVLVRTLLAVDEAAQSMTFAGDLPTGHLVQLMKADFERLVGGATGAATMAKGLVPDLGAPTLAIAVSCVGRRLVLGDRTEEEIEAVSEVLPRDTVLTGFYSYGELSPYATGRCDLHNQTMTLTTLTESDRPVRTADAAMAATSVHWTPQRGWSAPLPPVDSPRTLVLVFGDPELGADAQGLRDLVAAYPRSVVVGCSGSGEIVGHEVRDGVLSVGVARFEHTDLRAAAREVPDASGSYDAGRRLGAALSQPDLRAVFVLSEGLGVNGSELVRGFNDVLPASVVVTGGLAGDGTRFQKTWVLHGGRARSGVVAAVGFYGDHVVVGHGSKGGWDRFGPERTVTRSSGNVLYELDGQPALALYKQYLGAKAAELPASGLLFPLAMRSSASDDKVLVRTLLAVDEAAQSMTFAGDLPTGHLVQLMKADFERLVGGASGAATMAKGRAAPVPSSTLAVAISCVGRRLVLGDRTEEEIEAVADVLPKGAVVTGFYSYGELSPYATGRCDLHNQTMTLTTFAESATPLSAVAPAPVAPSAPAAPPRPPTPPSESAAAPRPVSGDATLGRKGGMQAATFHYDLTSRKWSLPRPPALDSSRTLVLAFGPSALLDQPEPMQALARAYPSAQVLGCSTSGEILGQEVRDGVLSAAVLKFEKTDLASATVEVSSAADSHAAGRKLARELDAPDLRAVFVLSEGLKVNGSELVRGLNEVLGSEVVVTGGLAGDGSRFQRTWVAHGTVVKSGLVAAVGFYGDHVVVGHGSKGGWDKFGPERTVTRSEGNVVFEIDGRPALALYKEYLGPKAAELPASGLLFPLAVRRDAADEQVLVRTLLAVDEPRQSLTFAGDVPAGHLVQLMKADFDRLVGGATDAAGAARGLVPELDSPTVAIAISCVGRRLVLGDRTEEEVEAVARVLPDGALVAGFYSYGELSPYATGACRLHNQTMTLTTFSESPQALGRKARAPVGEAAVPVVPLALTPPAPQPPAASEGTATVLRPAQGTAPVARGPRVTVPRLTGEQPRAGAGLEVQQRPIGPVTLVSLAGRVNEGFQGSALGRSLQGEVVLDLSRVERVTSFGVREWLALLKESEGRADPIWMAHCSEPVVNQITMIRGFAGRARVLSFFAPYTCPSCGAAYAALVDAVGDREAIETLTPPDTTCPRCGGAGAFDDDPQSYFSLRAHLAPAVSDGVARVLAVLDPAGTAEAVEKTIEGRLTRIRLHTPLDGSVRWSRVLDGVEGEVAFDLSGAASANAEGAAAFEAGLRSVARDVDAIRIDGAPRSVVERLLGARGLPPFELCSVVVDAHCDACSQPRAVRVDLVADGDRIRAGSDPDVPCKRCGQPLSFDATRTLLRMAAQGRPTAPTPAPAPVAPAPAPAPVSAGATRTNVSAPAAPPAPVVVQQGGPGWLGVAMFSGLAATTAVLAAVVCMGAFGVLERAPAPPAPAPVVAPPPPVAVAPTWTGGDVLPPAWTEVPVALSAAQVLVVGHGGPAATDEEALAQARQAALVALVGQLRTDLASPARDAVDARVHNEPTGDAAVRVVDRYLRDQGAHATPERSEATLRTKDGQHEAYAQYRLDRQAYDAVLADYGATSPLAGATVARVFPSLAATLASDADLWVVAVERAPANRSGVLTGDLLLSVDGTPVHAPTDLAPDGKDPWDRVAPGSSLVLVLEANGASREVRMSKPRPPPPPPTPRPAPGR